MNKLYVLFFAGLLTLPCGAQPSPDICGDWEVMGPTHSLTQTRLWIAMSSAGGLKAVMHSPYGNPEPILFTSAVFEDSALTLSIESIHIYYKGELSSDGNSIAGSWSKGKKSEALDFHRTLDAQPVTVESLEQTLAAASGKPDAQVAEQLYRLKLTERLSPDRLDRLEVDLPGAQAKQALIAISDRSAFLDPPATEILAKEKPDRAAQDKMLALTAGYVANTIHRLPNLFAARITTTFERDRRFDTPLHPVRIYKAVVSYRDGYEELQTSASQVESGLTTEGEFGPIINTVMLDIAKDNLIWSHWERGAMGPEAVFRYAVDSNHSHYEVEDRVSGYLGEIAIDPSDGTILRVSLRADMERSNPLLVSDLMVEYGPEELGGKSYICPKRAVALWQRLQLQRLNDVVFQKYHLFSASTRILPGARPIN